LTVAFGSPVLLQNQLKESGVASFRDVTKESGLWHYTNSLAANFLDVDRDGRLDLVIANVLPTTLPDYPKQTPRALNLFRLPQPEYPGDVRMFNFMHASWHLADNGGGNELWLQRRPGRFERVDSAAWGLPETGWALAIATADFNHDGF